MTVLLFAGENVFPSNNCCYGSPLRAVRFGLHHVSIYSRYALTQGQETSWAYANYLKSIWHMISVRTFIERASHRKTLKCADNESETVSRQVVGITATTFKHIFVGLKRTSQRSPKGEVNKQNHPFHYTNSVKPLWGNSSMDRNSEQGGGLK